MNIQSICNQPQPTIENKLKKQNNLRQSILEKPTPDTVSFKGRTNEVATNLLSQIAKFVAEKSENPQDLLNILKKGISNLNGESALSKEATNITRSIVDISGINDSKALILAKGIFNHKKLVNNKFLEEFRIDGNDILKDFGEDFFRLVNLGIGSKYMIEYDPRYSNIIEFMAFTRPSDKYKKIEINLSDVTPLEPTKITCKTCYPQKDEETSEKFDVKWEKN